MLTIHNVGDGVSRHGTANSLPFSASASVTRVLLSRVGATSQELLQARPLLFIRCWLAVLQTREAGWPSELLS